MKELLKLYNSLTDEEAKTQFKSFTYGYFDPKEEDGYKRPTGYNCTTQDIFGLGNNNSYNLNIKEMSIIYILRNLKYDDLKDILMNDNKLHHYTDGHYMDSSYRNLLLLLKSDDYRECINKYLHYYYSTSADDRIEHEMQYVLLFNKDFSKKNLQALFDKAYDRLVNGHGLSIFENAEHLCLELFGVKNMKKVWKFNEDYITPFREDSKCKKYSDLMFDELFFCNDGWEDCQKKNILSSITYLNTTKFQAFVEKILAVDMSYAKFLPKFFNSKSGLALLNEIIDQKKPEYEITNRSTAPRYDKKFRTLLRALYACLKENVCKTRATKLKGIAPLIQLYGYNFDCICEALYPEAF